MTKILSIFSCFVPDCDDAVEPIYDQPWVHYKVPGETDSFGIFTPDQCLRYANSSRNIGRNLMAAQQQNNFQCDNEMTTNVTEKCDRWVYDKYDDKTIVQEWSITCKDNQWKLAFVGTCHFAGIVIGSAAAGILADKYDRFAICVYRTEKRCIFIFAE